MALTKYVQERIEKGLTALNPEENIDSNAQPNVKVVNPSVASSHDDYGDNLVALMNFTFQRNDLLGKLRTRGSLIAD